MVIALGVVLVAIPIVAMLWITADAVGWRESAAIWAAALAGAGMLMIGAVLIEKGLGS